MDYNVKQRDSNTLNYNNQKIYTENTIRVNVGNGISEDSTDITPGVRQGCPLSPVLFNLYLDEVIRICFQKIKLNISKS